MSVTVPAIFLALAFVWFALPLVVRRIGIGHLTRVCATRRAIVLTYDDGPGEMVTAAVVDRLARRGTHATFFLIGREAIARPGVVARLVEQGHEIGNHTQEHRNAWKSVPWVTVRDIRAGRRSLDRLAVPPGPFRPPFGKVTLATLAEIWRSRQPLAFWTLDSRDSWENPRPIPEVLAKLEAQGGGVVLMHDRDAPPRARPGHDHRRHVLALTEAILDMAALKGFAVLRFCDLEEASKFNPTRR